MLDLLLPLQTTTPRTLKPAIQVTTTHRTTGNPPTTNSSLTEVTSSNRASSSTWSTNDGLRNVSSTVDPRTQEDVVWKPAVIECTHIFSTYVVTNVFHFLAFLTGFYMFRIQESEGLNSLIEKARVISCSVWQMFTLWFNSSSQCIVHAVFWHHKTLFHNSTIVLSLPRGSPLMSKIYKWHLREWKG